MSRDIDDSTRFMLESYKKDIDKLDEKWDEYLVGMIRLEEAQKTMSIAVNRLTKLLTEDNGRLSVISQLNQLTSNVQLIKTEQHIIKTEVEQIAATVGVPKEVTVERWKTAGLIVGGLIATVPGILSFIHSFM